MGTKRLRIRKGMLDILTSVREVLDRDAVEGYIVGGFVRDTLMQRDSGDVDIAVGADAMDLAPRIADALRGKFVPLDEEHQIARVVLARAGAIHLDIATMRGGIADDLALRDFTVDAMAISLGEMDNPDAPVIDPFGGRRDLGEGVVRAISEEAFRRDPARLLRAPRLAAECGFSLDEETRAQIRRNCQLIQKVAGERVRDELCRLLAVPDSARWLRLLDELGLLTAVFPELAPAKGSEQPKEHYWDVFEHSIETVATVEFLLRIGKPDYCGDEMLAVAPWWPALEAHFESEVAGGHSRKILLKLVALLHDIAKPQTRTIEDNGRMRFFGHSQQGAKLAAVILERLRFSSREKEVVSMMIEHHLRPGQLARDRELPTPRAIYRYFRDTGEAGVDTIFLNLADHLAARGPMMELESWREHAEVMTFVLEERFREESVISPPQLISGHDLIDTFDMTPGPRIGELLEAVREAQAAGEVATREEALDFVRHSM
jgi:poly(A) polymerase